MKEYLTIRIYYVQKIIDLYTENLQRNLQFT